MDNSTNFLAAALILLLSGCASITQSEMQRVSVTASQDGKALKDADCALTNDRGTWTVKAPAQVDVRKSGENLSVVCKKEGFVDGLLTAVSRAAGSMFGNIIFGGGIGAIIDHNKGVGYDYPDVMPVQMGKAITVDKKEELAQQQARNCQAGQTC
jgi:uncharacterized protein YceK